ncbi:MAG TPA: FG-GAP-like repeat-containing protein, partial [Steroidobacteraceae bacterium]|nr:FG-GAP-like repeat-containing protein [Steroidobacteraceae bacterium]
MTGDYDGDGYDDLYVTASSSPWTWHVLRSTGIGITGAGTAINTGITYGNTSVWQVGDFTGDG